MERIGEKLLNWASVLEDNTRAQAETTASMPFIHPHLALMPDAHLGKGATVGSVIPTLGAVIPAAVGVDIGCGMIAVRTQFSEEEFRGGRQLWSLRRSIEHAVPLSAGKYNRQLSGTAQRRVEQLTKSADGFVPGGYVRDWQLQLGTLGSGNHFIEVSVDEQSRVWLFLHSGSRGIGNKIAQRHIKTAQQRCERVRLPDRDLAYLTEDTDEFWHYIRELRWAQEFALLNRASLNSSPHGAGRNYSRSAAKRTFSRDDLRTAMTGIEYRHSEAFLDEIPQAYKDIGVVMADAADLVQVEHTLHQIVNIKGE